MPSRPSAARRRFHTDRVIAARLVAARTWSLTDPAEFVRGRMGDADVVIRDAGLTHRRCLCSIYFGLS